MTTLARIRDSDEYRSIAAHYGVRTARRSAVPLIRHIDDGLIVLDRLAANTATMRAFCLHPLIQADADLVAQLPNLDALDTTPSIVALALEYRHVANAALSTREFVDATAIALSPVAEVNTMLVADKVQNRVDFLRYHRATHPRSAALDRYFRLWLERLGVDEARYIELAAGL